MTTATAAAATAAPLAPAPKRRRARGRQRTTLAAWGFAAPFVILFLVFLAGPIVASFFMSFTDMTTRDLRSPLNVEVVGFANYIALFQDPRFLHSLVNTGVFVIIGVPLTMALALLIALGLDKGITKFRTVFRVGYYAPVVTSIVAIAIVWRFILQPDGLLNAFLAVFGISGPNWLQSTTWALPSLILMAVWRNIGTLMVIFLAGLQGVPREQHEAAMVDGANVFQRFGHVTMPALRPTILFAAVITGIGFLQFFEEPFVMTQGGPLDATLSAAMYTYDQFGFGNYAFASAASYVLFLAIVVLSLIQFRFLGRKD
ncbi:carbohydrate ABC transporter permease [Microbacterium terricola]|uniref:Sugar ABC transporter permease n=1 Tax=Microbacterium terricola TaxID=344163 RepID=A0ABM8E0R6_9MICO|nr:sugar ABC transporter permease [Microbacterium terricola]UYK40740.1 sugar ABC transporter permease [Microbacterium terricola]BDV31523.1 sugar ABC transporter permease [Microbacterium terricola]